MHILVLTKHNFLIYLIFRDQNLIRLYMVHLVKYGFVHLSMIYFSRY